MSQNENPGAEDLDLDPSDAASVVGGSVNIDPAQHAAYSVDSELARLRADGYVEEGCTPEGTMLINHKTKHRKMVKER
jgi:hypothetical protein